MYLYDYCTASDLKPQKIQPKTLNLTPHPFKINPLSFWGISHMELYPKNDQSQLKNIFDEAATINVNGTNVSPKRKVDLF